MPDVQRIGTDQMGGVTIVMLLLRESFNTRRKTMSKEKELQDKGYLKPGDVVLIEKGMEVEALIPRHFLYSNYKGDFSLDNHSVEIDDQFDYLCGEYIVDRVKYYPGKDGNGSTGSPTNYIIYCIKVDNVNTEISFYQLGWGHSIKPGEIKVIGKADKVWKWEK